MDSREHEKNAQKFNKRDCAYIHCEVNDKKAELGLAGDIAALTYGLFCLIDRLSELSDNTFFEILDIIRKSKLHEDKARFIKELELEALENKLKEQEEKEKQKSPNARFWNNEIIKTLNKGDLNDNAREC